MGYVGGRRAEDRRGGGAEFEGGGLGAFCGPRQRRSDLKGKQGRQARKTRNKDKGNLMTSEERERERERI